jgi:hypothetical protein
MTTRRMTRRTTTWAVLVVVAVVILLVVAADDVIPIVANEVMTTTPSCNLRFRFSRLSYTPYYGLEGVASVLVEINLGSGIREGVTG